MDDILRQDSLWTGFYRTLNSLGPQLLTGVHPRLLDEVQFSAAETDNFYSDGLHADFEHWKRGNPKTAIRHAWITWLDNVRRHLTEVVSPDALLPFAGSISKAEQGQLYRSVRKIRLRNLDQKHFELFVNSVLLEARAKTGLPTLITQAIVTPYDRSDEGKLIRAISIPWHAIIRELSNNWDLAYTIPAEKWEEIIAAAFDRDGYDEVTLTPRSGDHGRDIIAVKNGVGAIRILDSVKAYTRGHPVRHDDVRALAGVLLGDPKATKGIVSTTSVFAPKIMEDPFIRALVPYRLELMNGERLKHWLEDLALSNLRKYTAGAVSPG